MDSDRQIQEIAIVTGGAQGIGLSSAVALREAGYRVVVLDVAPQLQKKQEDIELFQVDVTDKRKIEGIFDDLLAVGDKLCVLVNNAGISIKAPVLEYSQDAWDKTIELNLTAPFILSQVAAARMIEQRVSGSIINITSMSSSIVNKGTPQVAYNVTKAGLAMLTKCLAAELSVYNIRVNAVAPGYVLTGMTRMSDPKIRLQREELIPLARIAEPSDIADVIVFLASNAARYITGQEILVDGGYTIW